MSSFNAKVDGKHSYLLGKLRNEALHNFCSPNIINQLYEDKMSCACSKHGKGLLYRPEGRRPV
jgi:hypothetical protein